MKGTEAIFSNKNTDWITPQDLFDEIKDAFDIKLDPCGHDQNILSPDIRTISKEENGLDFDWDMNTFINPPYSDIEIWVQKAIDQSCLYRKNFYVLLLPSRTDRPWFRKIMGKAIAVCFMHKRLKFSNAKNNAPFPSLLAVITCQGQLTDKQFDLLNRHGYVV